MKKLNELLGTEFPIIQGGMANIATGEFAAACSNAGALGVIATGGMLEADLLRSVQMPERDVIKWCEYRCVDVIGAADGDVLRVGAARTGHELMRHEEIPVRRIDIHA